MANNFTVLSQLLMPGDEASPLAFTDQQLKSRADWLSDIELWRQTLNNQNGQVFALYHSDAYQFSVLLFALWSLNKTVIIPANNRPETLANVKQHVDHSVGEIADALQLSSGGLRLAIDANLETENVLLGIFTSGSSGEPTIINKNLRQLESELTHLNQLWPVLSDDEWCVATVSHHHIYGLLFKVLLSLCTGRVFVAKSCEFIEEAHAYSQYAKKLLLVSSPTHLSRLPVTTESHHVFAFERIFSSGAALSEVVSTQAEQYLKKTVTEIYGSTETGGIAWREQTQPSFKHWQLLPGVEMALESERQCLMVRSKHLQIADQWYSTNDCIEMHNEQTFSLRGRVDSIVKIEGKRISIDEMKLCLLKHSAVDEVQLIPLQNRRAELGAVIVLSEQGKHEYAEDRKALTQNIKRFLADFYELPVIPRRWRFLSLMPVNAQGKVLRNDLTCLFVKASQHALPTVLQSKKIAHNEVELQLWIDKDLHYFDGHFDDVSVLPGIVMIHWLPHFMKTLFDHQLTYKKLEVVKFQQVVLPMQEVILRLRYDDSKQRLHFNYLSPLGKHSSGRMNFL